MTLKKESFDNTEGKGENAGNQLFLLFPAMFSTQSVTQIIILTTSKMPSVNAFKLDWSQFFSFGNKLIVVCYHLPAFSPFPTMFSRATFPDFLKVKI